MGERGINQGDLSEGEKGGKERVAKPGHMERSGGSSKKVPLGRI